MTAELQHAVPGDRFVRLERCANFRDLGGYAAGEGRLVRRGAVYRSMTPEYASENDVELVRSLGIRLVIDLRGRQAASSGPLGEPPARRLKVGQRRMLGRDRAALVEYAKLKPVDALPVVLLRLGKAYARAASAIANEEGPALVHCRLGKDRTGVFAAVLLKALGVSDEDVIEDYMLSGVCIDACHRILAEAEPANSGALHSRVAQEGPDPAAMREVLRQLNGRYGGAAEYLRFHGMRKRDVASLRERLLE